MTSLLAPTSFDNKETGIPSSNLNFTQRRLNSNPYRFPYRLSFLLFFFLIPSTFSMGSLLSPPQKCHPFTPSSLSHDLVVRTLGRLSHSTPPELRMFPITRGGFIPLSYSPA